MKSGLWILIVVIIVAIVVGSLLKGRLGTREEPSDMVTVTKLGEIEDPDERIEGLQNFILENPESESKSGAYARIASAMIRSLKDTTRFATFARETIQTEDDAESKAIMYYWLYRIHIDSSPDIAIGTARDLLSNPIDVSWIYNYMGYDLAERDLELDLALPLCDKAVRLSKTREDSASNFDSRGWVYYKKAMYKEALADLEQSIALFDEPYEEVLSHLAYAALKADEADKAFDAFRSILVMGEYDYARHTLDSLMTVRAYSPAEKADFEQSIWETRETQATAAQGFDLPTLEGTSYSYDPLGGNVAVLNFMSPT